MKYEVIDNFLDEEFFNSLITLFTEAGSVDGNEIVPWYFNPNIVSREGHKNYTEKTDKLFYMGHMLYGQNQPLSPHFSKLIPLLDKLEAMSLLRLKVNLFPNTEILHEHDMHIDFPFSHSGAIFSLNTCDGYTKLKDGTKINSVANRVLLFNPSEEHCSTTATNVFARINININYIHEQDLK